MALARQNAARGLLTAAAIPLLGTPPDPVQTRKVKWALRFPLPPPTADPTARRFSTTPDFNQGPRSLEVLDGALRYAAPFTYDDDQKVFLMDCKFVRLPDYMQLIGAPRHTDPPYTLDSSITTWLLNGAPRLNPREDGNWASLPKIIAAFFCNEVTLDQAAHLIYHGTANDAAAVQSAKSDFRKKQLRHRTLCRLPHPNTMEQARATGNRPSNVSQPRVAPLPAGLAPDATASPRGPVTKKPRPPPPPEPSLTFAPVLQKNLCLPPRP